MSSFRFTTPLFGRTTVLFPIVVAVAMATASCGGDTQPAELSVSGAWARPTPGGATAGAIYLTVVADSDDAIISVTVPADVAADAEMHASVVASHDGTPHDEMTDVTRDDGGTEAMMRMEELERIDLVADEPFEFSPGQTHIMILDLVDPLLLDQQFELVLELESGRSIPVDVVVADSAPTE